MVYDSNDVAIAGFLGAAIGTLLTMLSFVAAVGPTDLVSADIVSVRCGDKGICETTLVVEDNYFAEAEQEITIEVRLRGVRK